MTAIVTVTLNPTTRAATFSLSARRTGGEGWGEVGSPLATSTTEFNAMAQSCRGAEKTGVDGGWKMEDCRLVCSTLRAFALKIIRVSFACFAYFAVQNSPAAEPFTILKPAAFAHHIESFNTSDDEAIPTTISNKKSWSWLRDNIPLFECPDADVEEIYYFRWWSFRKHIKRTLRGYVVTEFLPPVSHAGEFNTISCAAGFHLAEGRWLRNQTYLNDYTRFWLRGDNGKPQPHFHKFSSWFAAAAWNRYLVNGDKKFIANLLPDLVTDYRAWEIERQLPNGLFWQHDVKDAMEESISGSRTAKNIRPTINSYMWANAQAIFRIAELDGKQKLAGEFDELERGIQFRMEQTLWNSADTFYEVQLENGKFSNAREAIGFVPWMFELGGSTVGERHVAAFAQLTDPQGFSAPFGFTTAERRHPEFRNRGVGTCEWDGAIWPFAASQTLYAFANVLRGHSQRYVTTQNYFDAFLTYTRSQHSNGQPYIGEYLDETTGDWINRNTRSAYYNHSTYADLLITGVIGLVPRADNTLEISPLLPPNTWDWFCLDGVKYHGHMLTVIWDKDGSRYGRGVGLHVFAGGKQIAHSPTLTHITGRLP